MANLSLVFDVLARDKASKEFNKIGDSADRAAKRGAAFGKALAGVAAAGVAALAGVVKVGFGELQDYQAGLAQADAVIKSTGGSAGVTSKHVEDLASAIQGYSGQTDDSIVAGENLLLTFTNIRNAAGKGNDIFDQSTKILADMSQALGQDTKTSAIQLGKALNDPVKGITALQRVGVSFSESQKKTIKSLVDTGHTADAQKVILAELNKEFGGSAKAFGDSGPGQIAKAKRSFEDVSQNLVTSLLPAITQLLKFINDDLIPAFSSLTSFLVKHKAVVMPLATILGSVAGTIFLVVKAVKIWREVQIAMNIVLSANPIGLIVVAIAALVAGLIYAYRHSATFRTIVQGAFSAISTAASFMWNKVLKPTFKFLIEAWLTVAGAIIHGAASAFGWVPGIGGKLKTAAKEFDNFKDEVNASLDGVHKNVHVTIDAYYNSYGANAQGVATNAALHGRATGGPVLAGRPYIVGEREPELFVPNTSGRIYNQRQMRDLASTGGSGLTIQGDVILQKAEPEDNGAALVRGLRNLAFVMGT